VRHSPSHLAAYSEIGLRGQAPGEKKARKALHKTLKIILKGASRQIRTVSASNTKTLTREGGIAVVAVRPNSNGQVEIDQEDAPTVSEKVAWAECLNVQIRGRVMSGGPQSTSWFALHRDK